MYAKFLDEIRVHGSGGYHLQMTKYAPETIVEWFSRRDWKPSAEYIQFLVEVGAGRYFGGSFVVYPLLHDDLPSVDSTASRLSASGGNEFYAIGYDGTTEGCYCLPISGQNGLFWHSWELRATNLLAEDLFEWVEQQPSELFHKEVYAGYKPVADMEAICTVIRMREAFRIRLLKYTNRLERPPGKEADQLPRYNRIELGITKTREVELNILTLRVRRTGSNVKHHNVEYVTVDISKLPTGIESVVSCFVFDPFNLPFESIQIEFNPVIDLGSKMRARYKEILDFL